MRLKPWPRKDKSSRAGQRMDGRDLWWVRIVLNVGRPLVAVAVLVMCAPGEHYLATLAHWDEKLAWGMPTVLTAYAGIAAVVATKRPKGAPGKKTAVAGAIVSVGLAMAAQPIAHLYGYRGLTTSDIVLITVVSCIPAAVFGHLLHMAAVPGERIRPSEDKPDEVDEGRTSVRDLSAVQVEVQGQMSEVDARAVSGLFVRPPSAWTDELPDYRTDIADLVRTGRTNGTVADAPDRTDVPDIQIPVRRTDGEGYTTWHGVSGDAMSWTPDSEPDRTDPDAFGYDPLDTVEAAEARARNNSLTSLGFDPTEDREVALSGAPTLVRNRTAVELLSGAETDAPVVLHTTEAGHAVSAAEVSAPRTHVIARPATTPVGREDKPVDVVRRLLSVYPEMSNREIRDRVLAELPGTKLDTISKATRRVRSDIKAAAATNE